MNYDEFKKLLISIESNYPKFKLEDYQIKFWWDKLKNYYFNDVYKKFQQHLDGELNYTYPSLNFLTKSILTVEQKLKQGKIFAICPFCGKKYEYPSDYSNWKKCHNRCSMINNILLKSKQFNINILDFFEKDIMLMKYSEIDKNYVKFLKYIYDNFYNEIDIRELNILKSIIETFPENKQQLEFF